MSTTNNTNNAATHQPTTSITHPPSSSISLLTSSTSNNNNNNNNYSSNNMELHDHMNTHDMATNTSSTNTPPTASTTTTTTNTFDSTATTTTSNITPTSSSTTITTTTTTNTGTTATILENYVSTLSSPRFPTRQPPPLSSSTTSTSTISSSSSTSSPSMNELVNQVIQHIHNGSFDEELWKQCHELCTTAQSNKTSVTQIASLFVQKLNILWNEQFQKRSNEDSDDDDNDTNNQTSGRTINNHHHHHHQLRALCLYLHHFKSQLNATIHFESWYHVLMGISTAMDTTVVTKHASSSSSAISSSSWSKSRELLDTYGKLFAEVAKSDIQWRDVLFSLLEHHSLHLSRIQQLEPTTPQSNNSKDRNMGNDKRNECSSSSSSSSSSLLNEIELQINYCKMLLKSFAKYGMASFFDKMQQVLSLLLPQHYSAQQQQQQQQYSSMHHHQQHHHQQQQQMQQQIYQSYDDAQKQQLFIYYCHLLFDVVADHRYHAQLVEIVDSGLFKLIVHALKNVKVVHALVPLIRTLVVTIPVLMKKQRIGMEAKVFSLKMFSIIQGIMIDWPNIMAKSGGGMKSSSATSPNRSQQSHQQHVDSLKREPPKPQQQQQQPQVDLDQIYSFSHPIGRNLHLAMQEFVQLYYTLFPKMFITNARNQLLMNLGQKSTMSQQQLSQAKISAIGDVFERYLEQMKFNPYLLYNSDSHELNMDKWKSMDIDKWIFDLKSYGTRSSVQQESTLRKALSPDDLEGANRGDDDNYSQIEQLIQENRPREFWWHRIMGVQKWIETSFTNESTINKEQFTLDVTELHKSILLLKNEILYEKCLKQELQQRCQKLRLEQLDSWKEKALVDSLHKKIKMQTIEIHRLQEEVKIWKKADRDARDRLNHWDTTLQSNLQSANSTIKRITEDCLTNSEKVDTLRYQIEELKNELNSKSNRIYELETIVSESSSRMEKAREQEAKLDALMKEVHLWERGHSKLIATIKENKELNEGIIFRNKIIDGISRKLELNQEKLQNASSWIHSRTEYINSLKAELVQSNNTIARWKEIMQQQENVHAENIRVLQQKYDTIKNLNTILQNKITEMRFRQEP